MGRKLHIDLENPCPPGMPPGIEECLHEIAKCEECWDAFYWCATCATHTRASTRYVETERSVFFGPQELGGDNFEKFCPRCGQVY